MYEQKSAAEEATDAFKTLLVRIGDIFGVFDLSFFVAGAVCAGAVVFGGYVSGASWPAGIDLQHWHAAQVITAILGSYVLGIVCFAAGRTLRPDQRFYLQLPDQLHAFALDKEYRLDQLPGAGKERARRCSLLYTRLWAEMRQDKGLAPSFNLVTRYWVMAAMCDGLGAALGLWIVLWLGWWGQIERGPAHPPHEVMVLVAVLLVGAAWLCFREARRYGGYQMFEIVATLAYRRDALAAARLIAQPNQGGLGGALGPPIETSEPRTARRARCPTGSVFTSRIIVHTVPASLRSLDWPTRSL